MTGPLGELRDTDPLTLPEVDRLLCKEETELAPDQPRDLHQVL